MKIVSTFDVIEGSLYSVQYEGEVTDEFSRLFDQWTDNAFLFDFFCEHEEDLQDPFWGGITVEEAVEETKRRASELRQKLLVLAKKGKTDNYQALSSLFVPLRENERDNFAKSKAKRRFLRIYAIKIEHNLFVVSGGAIKLRPTMNDRHYLQLELQKLEVTRSFLQSRGSGLDDDIQSNLFELF